MIRLLTKIKFKFDHYIQKLFRQSQTISQNISANKVEVTRHYNLSPSEYSVSQQEYDAFRMKAIVLLKQDALPAASFQSLLKNPVQIRIGSGENQKVVIKLSQSFEWSGRAYQLEGEFERDPTKKYSIPKTFKITQSLIT